MKSRFENEISYAKTPRCKNLVLLAVHGEQDDMRIGDGRLSAKALEKRDTVHRRHFNIEENYIRMSRSCYLKGLLAIGSALRLVSRQTEASCNWLAEYRHIV